MSVIKLENVSFAYPDASEPAIRNLSLEVEKGQFVVLFGPSGSGKSTLLRLLKKEIQPAGEFTGDLFIDGIHINEETGVMNKVGFVFQDPENQIVAEDVLHELVFGLENIGLSTNEMRSRVAEMVNYFGMEPLLHRKTYELSGGKKQQVNLASVLLMQPEILVLDEPTAQLDPVSAREFLDMLVRLNEEFGMTIILAEHRLEEIFTMADKIVMLDKGQISKEGQPREVLTALWDSPFKKYVPSIPSLFLKMDGKGDLPLTVKEGRNWIQTYNVRSREVHVKRNSGEEIFNVKGVSFYYDVDQGNVLKELDFRLNKGEIYALLGSNGSGKSTFLKLLAGLLKPKQGKIVFYDRPLKAWKNRKIVEKIGYLPQNPKLFFAHDSLAKEIQALLKQWEISDKKLAEEWLVKFGLSHLKEKHPYDLSGGELQQAALACLLLHKPEVLLLDEPTKGLDPLSKETLGKMLLELNQEGITIVIATHDVEFASAYASKCGMMFQGKITSEEIPENFFKGNFFYTTMIQRLFRHIPDNRIITVEEAYEQCE